jgi:hypothetical protein
MINQSLEGGNLDLTLLDERVEKWKISLDLTHQNNFPPPKFFISSAGVKFHDRSHLLVQDYLKRDSYSLREQYGEDGLPSIYEEALTVFAAQLTHYGGKAPEEFCLPHNFHVILNLLHQIDYIPEGSFFLTDINRVSEEMSNDATALVSKKSFETFRVTLKAASQDTPDWDNTRKIVNG